MSPTKHAPAKNLHKKNEAVAEDENEIVDAKSLKKKSGEIELPEEPIVVEDKLVEEETALATEEAEDAENEITLDDEELNPFGDKWEQ